MITFIIVFTGLVALAYFTSGLILMLLMGVLHSWYHVIPTMGYFTSCLIALLLRLLFVNPMDIKKNKEKK
jgi:hypothetical protein